MKMITFVVMILFTVSCTGQSRFDLALTLADATATGADAYLTHNAQANLRTRTRLGGDGLYRVYRPNIEGDALARPFVRTTQGQMAFFGTKLALTEISVRYLERKHPWRARTLRLVSIGVSVAGVISHLH
jgi:hypothetical protein